jgi:hypothetical protein
MSVKAKIFVSCGQAIGSDEVEVARRLAANLCGLGFDTYVAVEEQTLRGLKENIFAQLADSEYFVFIDFKREALSNSEPVVHRGSLFSHQELALATFLDIPVIALQEAGVRRDDGILRFVQANAVQFSDRHLIPDVVAALVGQRQWRADWRNELVLERDPAQYGDAQLRGTMSVARFFHIGVRNLNRHKAARNCHVYLESAIRVGDSTPISVETIEFKWAGSTLPYVTIGPQSCRRFDAVWFVLDKPAEPRFSVYSDSTEFTPAIPGIGQYRLVYAAVSENFKTARGEFLLTVQQSPSGWSLTQEPRTRAA